MVDFITISSPPNVADYEYLAKECLESVSVPSECYLFHYDPWGVTTGTPIEQELSACKFDADVIFWVVFDTICGVNEFNWWEYQEHQQFHGLTFIEELCSQYPDKKFIIFTSHYGFAKLCKQPNIFWIDLPPGMSPNHAECQISLDKNFDSEKPVIFLNNGASFARLTALSYMLARNLDTYCNVTASKKIIEVCQREKHFYHHVNYHMTPDERKFLDIGWQRLINWPAPNTEVQNVYIKKINDNVTNWNTHLIKKYQHSFLEIISSTSFSEPTNSISEKNWHQIYSRNIPLVLGCKGTIKMMEDMGFDMFTDIVDQSYDSIENPYERLKAVFDLNQHLLMDPSFQLVHRQ